MGCFIRFYKKCQTFFFFFLQSSFFSLRMFMIYRLKYAKTCTIYLVWKCSISKTYHISITYNTFQLLRTLSQIVMTKLILVDQSGRRFRYVFRILMHNMFSIHVQSCVTSLQNKSHDRATLQWLDMLNGFLMNHKREASCLTGDDNIVPYILCVCHSHGNLKHERVCYLGF